MMRILVVDDEARAGRADYFAPLGRRGREVTYYTEFPDLSLFKGVDLVSWDNYLGDDEVLLHLQKLQLEDPKSFAEHLKGIRHIVHSNSREKATEIHDLLRSINAEVVIIPISSYKHAIQFAENLQALLAKNAKKDLTHKKSVNGKQP